MAEDKAHPGWSLEMDAGEHIHTYEAFIKGAKWGLGFLIVLLSAMAFFLL